MAKTIEDLFVYLVFATDILIIILFILFLKEIKLKNSIWALVIYSFVDIFVNFSTLRLDLSYLFRIFLYDFFTTLEYSVFAYFLWNHIKNLFFRKLIVGISIVFIAFLIFYYSLADFRSIDSIPIGIESILILLFSFYYFFEQINDTKALFIYNKYSFWIVTGIMIYLAGSFFIYVFANHLDTALLMKYWFLTNVFYVIKGFFICYGIFIQVKHVKKSHRINLHPSLS